MSINGIKCFVHYQMQGNLCQLQVHSKLRPQPALLQVEVADPDSDEFSVEGLLARLQILIEPKVSGAGTSNEENHFGSSVSV